MINARNIIPKILLILNLSHRCSQLLTNVPELKILLKRNVSVIEYHTILKESTNYFIIFLVYTPILIIR